MTLLQSQPGRRAERKGVGELESPSPCGFHNLLRTEEGVGVAEENSLQMPELRSLQPYSPGPRMQPLHSPRHLAFRVVLTNGLLGDFGWGSCPLHSSCSQEKAWGSTGWGEEQVLFYSRDKSKEG